MANFTLTFGNDLNISVQVGDILYYTNPTAEDGVGISSQADIVRVGKILTIAGRVMTCEIETTTVPPNDDSFILFSKDSRVNMSSPVGYYGLAKFKNDSTVKGEMFAASCDVFESSK
ncbi:MAG: hypothetical protein NZ811_03990 [Gammaproteobacteria bacterium]|nr:hypothetical protein [Gammaproteobacteria bacterium]